MLTTRDHALAGDWIRGRDGQRGLLNSLATEVQRCYGDLPPPLPERLACLVQQLEAALLADQDGWSKGPGRT